MMKKVLTIMPCLLVVLTAGVAWAQLTPESVEVTLEPGEVYSETKTATLTGTIPTGDVLFSFDLTGSMGDEIDIAKAEAINIMNSIDALVDDAQYGVMSYMDYTTTYDFCDYFSQYGDAGFGDYPYSLDQTLTDNKSLVSTAITSLSLGSGWDWPQDYTRAFYESYADPAVGFRVGAKKIVINFGDAVPHDCNINENVPGEVGVFTTGIDPGRDGIAGTPDDLDHQDVLMEMADSNVTLLAVHSDATTIHYWQYWASLTGGHAYSLADAEDIPAAILELIEGEATFFDTLTIGVCTPGFEDWLHSVDPPYYAEVMAPDTLQFDIDLIVPFGTPAGEYQFTVCLLGDGAVFGEQIVTVTVPDGGDDITPTNEWINVFCGIPVLNGEPLEPGDIIRAYDPDGVLCGIDTVRPDGSYGFMPIYAEEPFNPGDQGAEPGDTITFTINGEEVFTDYPVIWTANGDSFELCGFLTCQFCTLEEGWNLVSWNREYAATIEEFLELLGEDAECVELILGFDQGAMTYDPDLVDFSTLHNVDYHFGYWFLLDCPIELEICGGPVPSEDYIHVYSGWNLVSYWPDEVLPVETALASIYDYIMVVLGYDGDGLTHIPGEEPFNTLTEMGPCYGYWIKSTTEAPLLFPGWTGPPVARFAPTTDRTADVTPSPTWVSLYGSDITVDSAPLAENSVIEAYTTEGVLCGQGRYVNGLLKFTPVYGHNETGEVTSSYPKAGDDITLHVNGEIVNPNVTWTENGDRIRISRLRTGEGAQLPTEYSLSQNYPNPFNPSTEIAFSIPTSGHVELTVFNILGQEVNRLVDLELTAGEYSVTWNGDDAWGNQVSSGLYLYRLSSGDVTLTKKMILTK